MARNLMTKLVVATLCLIVAGPAMSAEDADLSGEWAMTLLGKSPTGEKDATLFFERDGFQIKVKMTSKRGEAEAVGYVDGTEIRFYYVRAGKKEDVVAKYTGHVRGDLMGGEVDMGKGGKTIWMARRGSKKKVDLSGTWTLQMQGESPSGLDLVKMTFRQEGHNIVAMLTSELGVVECEGFIEDDEITFYYVRATGDGEFIARFHGLLGGAVIGGEVEMGKHGKTTWIATKDV